MTDKKQKVFTNAKDLVDAINDKKIKPGESIVLDERKAIVSERKKKQQEKERWLKTIFIPLVVGISLIATPINMVLFKVIGWLLFIFGAFASLAYLSKLWGINKEKIQKTKEDILEVVGGKKK